MHNHQITATFSTKLDGGGTSKDKTISFCNYNMYFVFQNILLMPHHNDNPVLCCVSVGLGGTKFISFEERHWHSDCFSCYKCNCSLVGRGFLTDGEDILCPECGRA